MVTKAQIAAAAGVSRTCVSLVLNDRPSARIAAQTRQRVIETARRLGYRPAAGPAPAAVASIAYVLGHEPGHCFDSPWHFNLMRELQQQVAHDARCLHLICCYNQPQSIRSTLQQIDASRPLGVVADGIVPDSLVKGLIERQMPLVVAGLTPFAHDPGWAGRVSTVSIDLGAYMHRLVAWLREQGTQRLALITRPPRHHFDQALLRDFQQALKACGLTYDPSLVRTCADSASAAHIRDRMSAMGLQYDGMLFASANLAAAATGGPIAPGQTSVPVASLGTIDMESDLVPQAAMGGCRCDQFSRLIYQLLGAQIANPSRKAQQLLAQEHFRPPLPPRAI